MKPSALCVVHAAGAPAAVTERSATRTEGSSLKRSTAALRSWWRVDPSMRTYSAPAHLSPPPSPPSPSSAAAIFAITDLRICTAVRGGSRDIGSSNGKEAQQGSYSVLRGIGSYVEGIFTAHIDTLPWRD